jgi:hypothetical protein
MNNPYQPAPALGAVGSRIPKRIIQTAASSDLPLSCRAAVANVRLLHPAFEYCFFNNQAVANFVKKEFPEYQSAFEAFPFRIQRYDFFRYLAVYRLGGFYFDTDVFLARSVDDLLESGGVFPFEELTLSELLRKQRGMDWELGNYAFGAPPGHPFLRIVIENCVRSLREPAWADAMLWGIPRAFHSMFRVLNTTGPGLVTRTFAEHPELHPNLTILFPDDVCDGGRWHLFGDYGVHLMQASWRDRDAWWRRRAARYWEVWKRARLLKQSLSLGPTRSGNWITRLAKETHTR